MSRRAVLVSGQIPEFGSAWLLSHQDPLCFRTEHKQCSEPLSSSSLKAHTSDNTGQQEREYLQMLIATIVPEWSKPHHRFSDNFLRLSNSHNGESKIIDCKVSTLSYYQITPLII